MPAVQSCLPQSRFPGDNGCHDTPLIGVFSALVLSFPALSIGGVWAMMQPPIFLSFFRLGSWSLLLRFRPASRGCSSDGALVALLRPMTHFTLALLRNALGWFLGRRHFTHQRSSLGAVDRADVSALWQVVLEYPSRSPPNRYFQHAHFIPIVVVGKRGEYLLSMVTCQGSTRSELP